MQLKYLACFYFPSCVIIFLSTGPHGITNALLWTFSLWLIILADFLSPKTDQLIKKNVLSDFFYDAILLALSIIHFLIIGLMLIYASQLQWNSFEQIITSIINLIVLRILVGTSSGSSAIIVAHELIHRRSYYLRLIGRFILYTVCYEHFIVSHLGSHHLYVATSEDMTTARLGESFNDYWKRVFIGHFQSAWCSEMERLGFFQGFKFHYKILANTVLQGIFVEGLLIFIIYFVFGWAAGFVFILQAISAVRLLETINYYQHWGLTQGKEKDTLAWVNQSVVTEYALVGLSNHIAHHQNSATSYQNIAYSNQGPIMPYGYFVTNLWVKLNNASYRKASKMLVENFFKYK